jgi:hypothetical protein
MKGITEIPVMLQAIVMSLDFLHRVCMHTATIMLMEQKCLLYQVIKQPHNYVMEHMPAFAVICFGFLVTS